MSGVLTYDFVVDHFHRDELTTFFDNDRSIIDRYIAEANAEVDSYLVQRYIFPYAFIPELESIAGLTIATYKFDVFKFRMYLRVYDDEMMATVKARYDEVLKELRAIVKGGQDLLGLIDATNYGGLAIVSPYKPKVFTRRSFDEHNISP